MLRPQHRLRALGEIRETLRFGARSHLAYCDIYTYPLESIDTVRMACIVGKRVHASSVVRHDVQRRVRAAFSALVPLIDAPYAVVIVVSNSVVLDVGFQSLISDIYYAIH